MRTPKEIFEIQKTFIERSKNVLAAVEEEKLIAMNSSKLLSSTLLAWLMAMKNGFEFSLEEMDLAKNTVEKNIEIILKQPSASVTEYLFACMLAKSEPLASALEHAKAQIKDINFLINASVVPYAWFGLLDISEMAARLESIDDKKRDLSIKSSLSYLSLLSQDSEPTQEDISQLQRLYKKRKSNGFYSQSRLYGGGIDNDIVCDIEYSAIAICKGYDTNVL
mgnify:FL=1|tara:strand:- start:805 stop:1470 length:666 start_codon:yes stop_codon:yes gene_type:complete